MDGPQNGFSSFPAIFFTPGFRSLPAVCSPSSLLCVDGGVPSHQIQKLKDSSDFSQVGVYELAGGESVKTRDVKQALEDWALSKSLGVDTTVIAVGGGATLDLVAFFAATYGRGVPLVVVPSTLLAMADACLGGKCGVNVQGIKNIVGTIYHPKTIIINVDLLQSLSCDQMASGFAEIAKHALLDSKEFVDELFASWGACLHHDCACLEKLIRRSLAVKAREYLSSPGSRHYLNLGHTVAHALEALEGPLLTHGVAVAVGLYVEAVIGAARGAVFGEVVDVTRRIVEAVVPTQPLRGGWDRDDWKHTLLHDKKNANGRPHVVWLQRIGERYIRNGEVTVPLEWAEVDHAFDLCRSFF